MDVHPTKNGINRYWSIAMLTWHHHFQSPVVTPWHWTNPSRRPVTVRAWTTAVVGPVVQNADSTMATDPWKKKVPDPGKSRLHDDRTWTTTDKQHFYSGWIASKSKDDIWYILRPFKPKWISMYSVNGCKWPIYAYMNIVSGMLSSILLIVSEIQLQWVCNYKV